MAIQPQRNFLSILFDTIFGGRDFTASINPYGNYSGSFNSYVTRNNPIVTNPWGVSAYVRTRFSSARGLNSAGISDTTVNLAPGQSYNYLTGQLSDPNLDANTAKRLNEATSIRAVNQAGFQQASLDSARQSQSVLATLDEMYFANARTQVDNGVAPLTGIAQANEMGVNASGTKTILGTDAPKKKPATQTALKRALT